MIVPQFWAEARVRTHRDGRQFTVRRFGWSDTSQADAQANADARAAEALDRLLRGERLARREPKVPYNGAAGVPIREEIVARYGDVIVTRNAYGARCLNTSNVLFADVDFPVTAPPRVSCVLFALLTGLAIWIGWRVSWCVGVSLFVVALTLSWGLSDVLFRAAQRVKGGTEAAARERISRFVIDRPEWALRLYRTPAGLRLLVTHRPFDPNEPAVREFFAAVGADPAYVRMCLNQQCFRARVSPKPWRIGIETHMKPRPGVWPVPPDRVAERQAWVGAYEAVAAGFAACEFVDTVGSGVVHAGVAPVVRLHDELSRATDGMPIA